MSERKIRKENSSKSNLSVRELRDIENTDQENEKLSNKAIKLISPLIFAAIALGEFLFIKNADSSVNNTSLYPTFLISLSVIYILGLIGSIKSEYLKDKLSYYTPLICMVFVLLTVYDILTLKTNILQLPYFPWLDMTLNSMHQDRSYLIQSVVSSLKLLFTGYIIGAILGIITGILAGYFDKVNYWVDPILKVLGPIPTTTWLPIVMVLAINLFQGAVFIIGLGVWFQVSIATITGIRNVDKSYYEAAQTLGANNLDLVKKVAIPSATPNIFQGLVAAMSTACNALIVAEMLGVESGLGWYITWKSSWADYSAMYGAIILLALTFIVVNILIKKISDRILIWKNEE